jgi:cytochrome c oxidase subunit 3
VAQTDIVIGDGGRYEKSPLAIPSKKLAMWLFIAADSITFGVVFVGYGFLRNASSNWPTPFRFSPRISNVMLMTLVLVTSGLTMSLGARKSRTGDQPAVLKWTFLTILLGLVFAALHIREWFALMREGMTLSHNPWGSGLLGATFFSITGLHLLHVIGGVIALSVVALGYRRGRYNSTDVEIWGLYWHFVELVWMFVVPTVYLLNIKR